jgi:predicted transglutaminase-like cysteine proteinase
VIESTPLPNLGKITSFRGETARDRVMTMFIYVAKSLRDPLARTIVADAIRGCPSRDDWCEIQAIYWIVRNHLRYTSDVRDIDTYQTLRRMWTQGIADCDDFTIAYITTLMSAGFRAGAKIIAQDGQVFNHVYAVVEMPKGEVTAANRRIVPLDGTVPSAIPGWEPDKSQRKLERIYWYQENSI